MTAEVAILNKQAVALAADSAVTVSRGQTAKILTSANKIFALSKYRPVGVMVFGSAEFMGVPWETLVKEMRSHLGSVWLPDLTSYANELLDFLTRCGLFHQEVQRDFFSRNVRSYYTLLREDIMKKLRGIYATECKIGSQKVSAAVSVVIDQHYRVWRDAPVLPVADDHYTQALRGEYAPMIHSIRQEVFENLPMTKSAVRKLDELALWLFTKWPEGISSGADSGVVVAGFGEEDVFPKLVALSFAGVVCNRVKHRRDATISEIGTSLGAVIMPFAQTQTVYAFMEGVEPQYEVAVEQSMRKLISDLPGIVLQHAGVDPTVVSNLKNQLDGMKRRLVDEYLEELKKCRHRQYVEPILEVVASLSKQELATMAEALVSLTSLRKRLTMREEETVAGPVDVAVVSKGDGFIWIRRKHYFAADLNPRFLAQYYAKEETDSE